MYSLIYIISDNIIISSHVYYYVILSVLSTVKIQSLRNYSLLFDVEFEVLHAVKT